MEDNTLAKIHLAALRQADRIVFCHKDGESVIRAIKEHRRTEKDPFAEDAEVTIPCRWSLTDYAEGDSHISYTAQQAGTFVAFEMIHASKYDECFKTAVNSLRAGDTLTLAWKRDAWRTGNLTDVNLHGDALDLHVHRDGKLRLAFHIHVSVCPDNTARMIRVPFTSTRASEARNAA